MTLGGPAQGGPAAPQRPARAVRRIPFLDSLRGVAVAAMVADHVALMVGVDVVRLTLGRIALPVFFVLAGYLLRTYSMRHLGVGLVGLGLVWVVPWIDSPNVLAWYGFLAAVVVAGARWSWWPWLLLVLSLGLLANGWGLSVGTGYPGAALLAFLATGVLLRRSVPLEVLPAASGSRVLRALGRFPVSVYVGHLLVLEGLRQMGVFA